jgi:hypothetical protein
MSETTTHSSNLAVVETAEGRKFQAVCSCGWASQLEWSNRCMGNWRRHAAAARRASTKGN